MKTNNIIKEGEKIMTPVIQPILNIIERWESSQLEDSEKDEIYNLVKNHIHSLLTTILENELGTLKEIQVLADKEQALETDLALQEIIKDKEETLRLLTG